MWVKHPRFVNPLVDEDSVSVGLKLDEDTFSLSVSFDRVYDDGDFMEIEFWDVKGHFLDYVVGDIENQCMEIMLNELEGYELDWDKIIWRKKMIDEFKKWCNFWYKKYWTKNRSDELINEIKNYITSIIWLSSVDTKDADKKVLDWGNPNEIVVKHYNGEYEIERMFLDLLEDKIDYSLYCLRKVTGEKFDFFNLAEVIDKWMEIRYEEEYVERERYFKELSDCIIL